jgi:Tfp pilus assembly protein PilO
VAEDQGPISQLTSGQSPLNTFGTIIFFVVVLEIALLFFLNLYQAGRITTLTNKVAEDRKTLATSNYATLNNQIEEVLAGNQLLGQVLASRVQWSTFYKMLDAVTPKNTRFNSLTISEAGTFKGDGQTTSLGSLAQALVAWQKGTEAIATPFSSIALTGNNFTDVDGRRLVSFSIAGQVNLGKLKWAFIMTKQPRLGLILFVVAILAWFGLVRSQTHNFSEKLLQSKARQLEVTSYDQRIKDIDYARAQGEAIQGTLRALFLAMPKSSQVPEVLVMIENLGSSAGVTFTTASVGAPSGNQVPISIAFGGSLDNVTRFLDAIHNNIRTGIVRSQTVNADKGGNLTVTLQLGLVYQGGVQ